MKTAIDVVLLPSPEMMTKVIEVNRMLAGEAPKIALDTQNCLPHLSLCMGVVDDADLPKARAALQDIAENFSALQLMANDLHANTIPTGETISGLRIQDEAALRNLHVTIMNKLWPYLTYEVTAEMLYNPSEIEDVTFSWIKGYAKKHEDPSLFHPHITVGVGETRAFANDFPMAFRASRLALCQLGNYCTARKIISEFKLPG